MPKLRTKGFSIKVAAQGVVAAIGFFATYFPVDADPEVAGAVALVLGAIAGWVAPPNEVEPV